LGADDGRFYEWISWSGKVNYWHATLYGILQGVAEFLPISSSGHLALLPTFIHIPDPGVFFDLVMHLGTLVAIGIYFRRDFIVLLKDLRQMKSAYVRNFCCSMVATIILVGILKITLWHGARQKEWIAINLIFFGFFMWAVDRFQKKSVAILFEKFSFKASIVIGLLQALSIFPGTSRSGITMTAGRLMGIERTESSRFSFLLAFPITLLAFLSMIPKAITDYKLGEINFALGPAIWGLFVSFVFGMLTVHFFLKLIKNVGFLPFFIYRLVLGISILLLS
jgi:undecaprenyl-diphosphatase